MRTALAWVGLTVFGFLVVGTVLHFPGSLDDQGPLAPSGLMFGTVTGLLIGAIQLPALRGRLTRPWLWPLAMAGGLAITHGLGDGGNYASGWVPVGVLGGIAAGALQALVLRQPWWGVLTALAFALAIPGGEALGDAASRHVIVSAATGLLYALATVPLLARTPARAQLLRRTAS
ncbi:MAG: hypothetical protein ABI888_00080 [Chloroflexota bacterium]